MKRKKIVTRSNGKALSNDEIMDMLNKAIEGPASESLSSSTESSESENSGAEESRRPEFHETNETSNKRRLKKKKKKDMVVKKLDELHPHIPSVSPLVNQMII
ncbi:uncharacterized protein LOC143250804 [Tachypleus tridentatus]|uniref:uncharacterized protein LOC143250804 n=1 Tax=Tachypleus tridentatus TaxID=6853 RepID=UPI003FD6BEB9